MLDWLNGFEQRLQQEPLIYKALYQHLENAIRQGALRAGDRLPPQRMLAEHIGVAVATVTRVYRQAEQQGLIYAKVGKGSFVSASPLLPQAIRAQDYQCINLSIIKPQVSVAESQLEDQFKHLCEHSRLSDFMDYNPDGGSLTDQQTAREWLSQHGVDTSDRAISICSGAQHGLMLLMSCVTQHADCIAVEAFCYPGIISLANQLGRTLIGINMDRQGIIPESLERACQEHDIKMLIVVASHQNPTGAVMSKARRRAIAKIVKQYSIWLVDDDVYGFLSPELPPISNFAPEHSFYLTSLSKSMLPGLRVGYLVSPSSFRQRIDAEIRNSIWMPVPLTLALASRLIYSGQALDIQQQQSQMATARQRLAKRLLAGCEYQAQSNSYHLWLTLPAPWSSDTFSTKLEQQGVLVSSADYFCAEHQAKTAAVRISLMATKTEEELGFALKRVRQLLLQAPESDR
ncbi:PLP-dependent aminotransferase family protein [Pseudoteredinibacter isoporae]|uniref:aminotransferase-like domain-containing protein n=1 Tax=Pseudoteredinibacter isoporae TaxID=570281 RepID=UPI00310B5708